MEMFNAKAVCLLVAITLLLLMLGCTQRVDIQDFSQVDAQHTEPQYDDTQFQKALDSLPTGGGILNIENGHYMFERPVTRDIDNITVIGIDHENGLPKVFFSSDDETPIFVVGGHGWTFIDINLDLGGVDDNGYNDVTHRRVNICPRAAFPRPKYQEVIVK